MADLRTTKIIRTRKFLKRWSIPILLGAVGHASKAIFDWTPINALISLFQAFTSLIDKPEDYLNSHPTIKFLSGWVAGPLTLGVAAYIVVKFGPINWFINWLFPDPPPFVFSDLDERRRSTMTLLRLEGNYIPDVPIRSFQCFGRAANW
ncbi:hypothetical protein [Sphingomonas radiodurans]|uniref:hypothetical protein n=1 Tax=Sphingomonas radiodurans TaxID=2890321 RepID=UPI001E301403|nr:hypothetical protein [Sphingomonas radiodurans]WBH18049.1 hypothetical protein LLW23_08145 [Sphingomonas radiodurans]